MATGAKNPNLYPDLPSRALPVGIVVTPTKGLAANIVLELKNLGVPALSYCHETVTEARKTGRHLAREIGDCKTWNVICVDPEHLRDKVWRDITANDVFRANILYGCTDEAHLIRDWGAEFRPQFRHIGTFFRGRLSGGKVRFGNRSEPEPNLNRTRLLAIPNSGRKAIVHCRTIDDVLRVFLYLWNDNEEILRLLDEDPVCQVAIATVALAKGLNVKSVLDSISIGFPETVEQMLQEKGRAGRDPKTVARGYVMYQPSLQCLWNSIGYQFSGM
ncbi:P-loop containing nucleoside triphosphate hydrolase protein [Mycena alexandri]|uniref:DNA 3'-5' helicase n=1 Tax=Mycena alexandri TaxID=1745969 RepID=A0AAD6SGY1_9AGAR|nr:P-loop containing nucleoside triphosphate hydrolase protein [Mycena alexandri]